MRGFTRSAMSWRGLAALLAALGAAGAVGFAIRKRYADATAEAEKASIDDHAAVPAQANGEAQDVSGLNRTDHSANLA
jgi:hypothetical protein